MIEQELIAELQIPAAIFIFLWGLIWGSFFNVCIYRIPAKKSVSFPPSHCYHCGTNIKWYDNIPLVSYVLLRGNCRACGIHFSPRYFGVELLTALLFLAVFLTTGITWALPFHLIFVSMLIIGTFTDIDHFIIPDRITIGGAVFGFIATVILGRHSLIVSEYFFTREFINAFSFTPSPFRPQYEWYLPAAWSAFGAAFGYGLLWLIGLMGRFLFRKEAMGMGDVKLFAFIGAYMGAFNCILVLFLSALIGAVFGSLFLLIHKLRAKETREVLEFHGQPTVKSQWIPIQKPTHEQEESDVPLIRLEVTKNSTRQLHHFPYGPYIALAALLILIFRESVHTVIRDYLTF